jgi:hypothetical protein
MRVRLALLALIASAGIAACGGDRKRSDVAPKFLACLHHAGGHLASRAELVRPASDPQPDIAFADDRLSYQSITVATTRSGVRRAVVVLPAPHPPFDAREFAADLRKSLDRYRAVVIMPASRDPSTRSRTAKAARTRTRS